VNDSVNCAVTIGAWGADGKKVEYFGGFVRYVRRVTMRRPVVCGGRAISCCAQLFSNPSPYPVNPRQKGASTVQKLFLKLVEEASAANYLAVCDAISSHTSYAPYSDELARVEDLFSENKLEEARSCIFGAFPNLLVSPRAHWALAAIANRLKDDRGRSMEQWIAARCVEGVLATGEGTREKPYVVLRTSDEYDVLQFRGKKFVSQALQEFNDKCFDAISCEDGSELWFDITRAYAMLKKPLSG